MFDRAIGSALVPARCPKDSLTPCIYRATWNPFTRSWAWRFFPTGDISFTSPYPMPWTIQDGSKMRGVAGELWVISGGQHLKYWVP